MAPPALSDDISAPLGRPSKSTFAPGSGARGVHLHSEEAGRLKRGVGSPRERTCVPSQSSSTPSISAGSRQKGKFPPRRQHHQHGGEQDQSRGQTSAYEDDGTPSSSLCSDLRRSLALIHEERHLVAYDLYRDVLGRLEKLDTRTTRISGTTSSDNSSATTKRSSATYSGGGGGGNTPTNTPITPSRSRRVPLPFHSPLRRRQQQQQQQQGGALAGARDEANRVEDIRDAKTLLEQKEDEFTALEKRAKLFLRAKQNLTIDDDWIKAQTLFGITTYYRRENDGSLSIKLEGHLTGIPLFEQLAVLRETDLYHSWAPFCVSSSRLAQLGKIDVVAWFLTGLPKFGLSRDACFRAIGCDSMREDGSILLVGEGLGDRLEDGANVKPYLDGGEDAAASSGDRHDLFRGGGAGSSSPARRVDRDVSGSIHNESSNYSNWAALSDDYDYGSYLSRDSVLDTIQIPPVPNKFGAGRMTIRSFQGAVDVLSPSSAKTRLITNIDPNLNFIPQSLIDYCMKKMCGIVLSRLQGCARGILNDPVHSLHARRIREDVQFYRLWLLPKFRSYCGDLGWDLPPVAAFNVSEEDLDEEEWLLYSQINCRQEGGRPGNEIVALKENTSIITSDGTTRQQCAKRASSLDGHSISRRLFSSENSLPEHDRTIASAPVMSQPHIHRESVRTKLRQLLPAESMEIALTRPDILQRWEQRQAKKKALEVASARRRAALRLRPAQPTEEQAARLVQLKEAKEQFLMGKKNRRDGKVFVENGAAQRDASGELSSDLGTRSMSSLIVDCLSFTHPRIPHRSILPLMMAVMFALYHSDNHNYLQHSNTEIGWMCSFGGTSDGRFSHICSAFQTLAPIAIFGAILGLYSMIHWIVMNLALVVAFDFIEFPLLSLAGTKRELENAKSLYSRNLRVLTAYFSAAIPVFVMISCFLSYCWNRSLATRLPNVFDAIFGKAEKVFLLDSVPRFNIGPIFYYLGWIYHAFFRFCHWVGVELFAGYGSGLRDCICSLFVVGFAVDTEFIYESWREEALEKSKTIFSYSSAFLCSFIAIAFCVFPTKSSGGAVRRNNVEIYNNSASRASNDKHVIAAARGQGFDIFASTAGSSTNFSLASGEIEDSPETMPRQRAAT